MHDKRLKPCPVCDGEEGDLLGFDDEWMDDDGEDE